VEEIVSSQQEAAREEENLLWKSLFFLYNMLRIADKAPYRALHISILIHNSNEQVECSVQVSRKGKLSQTHAHLKNSVIFADTFVHCFTC